MLHSHSFVLTKQRESISQRFLSLLITPFQPARPIDRRLIGEWIGVEMVRQLSERIICLLSRTMIRGSSFRPLFSTITAGVDQLCDTDGHEEERRWFIRNAKENKTDSRPRVNDSTTNLLNEGGWIAYSQPRGIRKSLDWAYAQSSEAGGDSIRSNVTGFVNAPSSKLLGIRSFSRKGPILQYHDWVDQARS